MQVIRYPHFDTCKHLLQVLRMPSRCAPLFSLLESSQPNSPSILEEKTSTVTFDLEPLLRQYGLDNITRVNHLKGIITIIRVGKKKKKV